MDNNKYDTCRICGFLYPESPPWGKDGNSPTFNFCICCGVEFGYQDVNLQSSIQYRKNWIKAGMKWDSTYINQPSDWNPLQQMKNIPQEYLI